MSYPLCCDRCEKLNRETRQDNTLPEGWFALTFEKWREVHPSFNRRVTSETKHFCSHLCLAAWAGTDNPLIREQKEGN